LKTNIKPLQDVLQNLTQLNGYAYGWKEEGRDKEQQIGLLCPAGTSIVPTTG
jgi:hypothetical protein